MAVQWRLHLSAGRVMRGLCLGLVLFQLATAYDFFGQVSIIKAVSCHPHACHACLYTPGRELWLSFSCDRFY